MFEYAVEFGAAVKADYQLSGTFFTWLDLDAGAEFFADFGLQALDVRVAGGGFLLARCLHRKLFLHQQFGLAH